MTMQNELRLRGSARREIKQHRIVGICHAVRYECIRITRSVLELAPALVLGSRGNNDLGEVLAAETFKLGDLILRRDHGFRLAAVKPVTQFVCREQRGCRNQNDAELHGGDGVLDGEDQCPDQAKGDHPDASKPGCPAGDKDGDGVFDSEDQCVDTAAGALPDPDRKGCPASDRDGDLVPDSVDACPDSPGVPEPDAKKSGCPNPLVEIHGGQIIIKRQIFFAFNKDLIMPVSVQILQAVANVMKNTPQIKKLRVEGHTDNSGNPAANLWLSGRRAEAVMRWLADHGVDSSRLDSQGFGDTHPIGDNQTQAGRVQNRRVDFVIVE